MTAIDATKTAYRIARAIYALQGRIDENEQDHEAARLGLAHLAALLHQHGMLDELITYAASNFTPADPNDSQPERGSYE